MKGPFPASRLAAPVLPSASLFLAALLPCLPAHARAAEPALRLTAQGSFDVPAARAGDTVRYRLRVEWREVPAAVALLPREELETAGFLPAGSSTVHRKSSGNGADGDVANVTEFTYALVAREAGTARVSPFALRYHNGLTGREEAVNVPGSLLEIAPARKPLTQRAGVRALAALVAAAALAGLLRPALSRRRRKRRAQQPSGEPGTPLAREIETLRGRCEAADGRAWLADAERLCTAWLCGRIGIANPANVRFEAALDQYLARRPGMPPGEAESWVTLRNLFHEARYAGGRREPHELREACRHMKNCLQPKEGIEHGQPVTR